MDFFKLNPPTFDGKPDPIVAEKWLRDIKKIFATIGTSAKFWVIFAIYKLFDGAAN